MGGWIKLDRSMLNHWVWQDAETLKLWLEMLMRANFEDKKRLFNGQLVDIKRGQLIFGRKVYAERLGMKENKVRTIIKLLEKDGMIRQQTTNKYTVISITSYDCYQETTNKPPADHPQTTGKPPHLKKVRSKEVKNTTARFVPPSAEEVIAYCNSRGNGINGENFVDWYAARGWKVGAHTMKDWKAAVRTWEQRRKDTAKSDDSWEVSR